MGRGFLKYGISIVLVCVAVTMLAREEYIALFKKISFLDLLICLLFSFGLVVIGGFTMNYFIAKHYQKKLHLVDILTLPLMINLWGFLMPVRGGILYSIFFFKTKYQIKFVQGASMTLFLYTTSFVLMGVGGVFFYGTQQDSHFFIMVISLFLVMSPLIIVAMSLLFQKIYFSDSSVFKKIQILVSSVVNDFLRAWNDRRTLFSVVLLIVARYIFLAARYSWAADAFNLEIPFAAIVVLTFGVEFSDIVFRFLPGNMGLSELVAGGLFGVVGQEVGEGLLIALFIRFTTLLLTFTVGTWAVLANMEHFHVSNLKLIWQKIKTV